MKYVSPLATATNTQALLSRDICTVWTVKSVIFGSTCSSFGAPNVTSCLCKLTRASGTCRTLQVEPKNLLQLEPHMTPLTVHTVCSTIYLILPCIRVIPSCVQLYSTAWRAALGSAVGKSNTGEVWFGFLQRCSALK